MYLRGRDWRLLRAIEPDCTVFASAINGASVSDGPLVHPGEMLREEFMKPLGISINGLALELHVPVTRISQIVNERRGITADTALRLARHFGTSADFWMNIQKDYELLLTRKKSLKTIERQVRRRRVAA